MFNRYLFKVTISLESTKPSTLTSPYLTSSKSPVKLGTVTPVLSVVSSVVPTSVTVTLTVAVLSPNVTVIVAVPSPTPVIVPLASTVTTESSLDSNVASTAEPLTVGFNVSVSPTSTSTLEGVTTSLSSSESETLGASS